jgi:uncharacterized repeat protein (TIGR01451 family)
VRRSGLNLVVLALALAGPAAPAQPTPPPALKPIVVGAPRPADKGVRPASYQDTPAPQVMLEKVGPSAMNAGKAVRYEIVVRNPGAVALASVRVQEELPSGAVYLGAEPPADVQGQTLAWTLTDFAAGAERRIAVEVRPGGEGPFRSVATATFQAASTWEMKVTRPQLALTITGPERAQVGDGVPFQLRISNTGSGPAANAVVHVRLTPGLRHPEGADVEGPLGTLAPGDAKTITLTTTAATPGPQVAEAAVTADEAAEATGRAAVSVLQPALQLRLTGTEQCFVHREADFRLEVANPGQAAATAVVLRDVLPPGLDFVAADGGGVYQAGTRTVEWQLGTLDPGQTRSVGVKLSGRSPGEWNNQAVARADRSLEATASAKVTVDGVPALRLEMVDLEDPVEVGEETTYEIRVINQGSSPCTGLRIDGVLPPGSMDFVAASGPTASRVAGQQVSFEPLPKIAARADVLYRVRVRGKAAGTWLFTVQLMCDQMQRPVIAQESTTVYGDAAEGGPPPAPAPAPQPLPGRGG